MTKLPSWRTPLAVRCSTRRVACVLLPQRSTPSSRMKAPRALPPIAAAAAMLREWRPRLDAGAAAAMAVCRARHGLPVGSGVLWRARPAEKAG